MSGASRASRAASALARVLSKLLISRAGDERFAAGAAHDHDLDRGIGLVASRSRSARPRTCRAKEHSACWDCPRSASRRGPAFPRRSVRMSGSSSWAFAFCCRPGLAVPMATAGRRNFQWRRRPRSAPLATRAAAGIVRARGAHRPAHVRTHSIEQPRGWREARALALIDRRHDGHMPGA